MSPSQMLQRVDIFISSPSDVAAEREIIIRVIEKLNRLSYIRSRYVLNPLAYEREVPPASGAPAQIIVDRYMIEPKDGYLLLCVMWSRMGTPFTHPETKEAFQSGTEYEFISAYRANQDKGEPHLLLYRKTEEKSDADIEQKAKVDTFFKRFQGDSPELKGLYKTYTSLAEFEDMIFQHIEKILIEHPPELDDQHTVDANERPEIQEESRRLDAAMPRQVSVGQPTEVWVQICLPESEGFRSKLPAYTKEGDVINKEDVREGSLAVAFPIDKATGKPILIQVSVDLKASDFTINEPHKEIMLSAERDSGLLVFSLTPNQSRAHSIVHVIVRQTLASGLVVELGSAGLSTEIKPTGVRLVAQMAWTVLSLPLAAFSTSIFSEEQERQRQAEAEERQKAEETERQRLEENAERLREAEEAARLRAEEEARLPQMEETARLKVEDDSIYVRELFRRGFILISVAIIIIIVFIAVFLVMNRQNISIPTLTPP